MLGFDDLRNLNDLLRCDEQSSNDILDQINENKTSNNINPGHIGPKNTQAVQKSLSTAEKILNTHDIWDEEDIISNNKYTDVFDPRCEPQYTIHFKQTVDTSDIYLHLSNKTPSSASCEFMVIIMPNKLKELVSKKKIRYVQDGFDLDLSYITSRIIAMGFPAQSWEGIYRNHIDDVVNFFHKKHAKHYQIYNLCNERHIDEQKFEQDSINHRYPFNDHNPPMFTQMIECCDEINLYLKADPNNVVAIQCKAGKGRTGVIVCACLISQELDKSATEILKTYGERRTTNGKGVTIPSQIRFIYYFEHFLRKKLKYTCKILKLNQVSLDEMPIISGNGYEIQFVIYVYDQVTKQLKVLHTSQFHEVRKDGQRSMNLLSDEYFKVSDDLKFQFILKSKFGKKENICHCWLNTFFIVHKPQIQSFQDGMKHISNPNKIDSLLNRKGSKFTSDNNDKFNPNYSHAQNDSDSQSYSNKSLYKLRLQKHEIDKACKDLNNKTFPSNFSITFFFENHSNNQEPQPIMPRKIELNQVNSGQHNTARQNPSSDAGLYDDNRTVKAPCSPYYSDIVDDNTDSGKYKPALQNPSSDNRLYVDNSIVKVPFSPCCSDNTDDNSESSESSNSICQDSVI